MLIIIYLWNALQSKKNYHRRVVVDGVLKSSLSEHESWDMAKMKANLWTKIHSFLFFWLLPSFRGCIISMMIALEWYHFAFFLISSPSSSSQWKFRYFVKNANVLAKRHRKLLERFVDFPFFVFRFFCHSSHSNVKLKKEKFLLSKKYVKTMRKKEEFSSLQSL